MNRGMLAMALALAVAAATHAQTPGFIRDFEKAKADARATGKLILIYFDAPG